MAQNEKDDVIAAALAAGKTQEQAAEVAGVGRRTVVRRLTDPKFKALVTHYRQEIVNETLGLYASAGPKTLRAMEAVLDDGNAAHRDKIKAAEKIIELFLKLQSSFEVVERLKAIEDKLGIDGVNPAKDPESGTEGSAGADGDHEGSTASHHDPAESEE